MITQSNEYSLLSWNGNQIYMFAPASLSISNEGVLKVLSGEVYLVSDNIQLGISEQVLVLNDVEGYYTSGLRNFILVKGSISDPAASSNELVYFDGTELVSGKFDRSVLQAEPWTKVMEIIDDHQDLPIALADVVSPQVLNIMPESGSEVEQAELSVSGQTELGVKLSINDQIVAVDEAGNFNHQITLISGENKVDLLVVDEAGNETSATLFYTYLKSEIGINIYSCVPSSPTSDVEGVSPEFVYCAIDLYRQNAGVAKLIEDPELAAVLQSYWVEHNQDTREELLTQEALVELDVTCTNELDSGCVNSLIAWTLNLYPADKFEDFMAGSFGQDLLSSEISQISILINSGPDGSYVMLLTR